MGRPLHQKLGDDQRQYHDVTAEIAAARKEVIHDAGVRPPDCRRRSAEIQKERAERQAARAEVQHLTEDVQHLRSWLVTVFLTWGLVVAVVGALLTVEALDVPGVRPGGVAVHKCGFFDDAPPLAARHVDHHRDPVYHAQTQAHAPSRL